MGGPKTVTRHTERLLGRYQQYTRGPPQTSGYDGGKQVKGRKRQVLVDTLGLLLRVLVHPADIPDQVGGQWLLEDCDALRRAFPRLERLWVDSAYHERFVAWVHQTLGWTVQVVKRPSRWVWVRVDQEPPEIPGGFQVLPKRWIVERTFGWLGRWRRTSKDYDYLPATSECVVELVMIRIMLRRLAESEA
jgi:putative transposase